LPRAVVITGPSGVGKGTLIRSLRERMPELELSVSATTRAPRPGETPGVDYHFLEPEEFGRRVAAGEFVEQADYAGARYGTLRSELESRSADGAPVVLEIELQGARQVRETMPSAVQIFIAPPSLDALRARSSVPRPTTASRSRPACAPPSASSPRRASSRTSS
jgi:guanylate kinase